MRVDFSTFSATWLLTTDTLKTVQYRHNLGFFGAEDPGAFTGLSETPSQNVPIE